MEAFVKEQLNKTVSDLIVGAVKSIARHNKRAAELLMKAQEFGKRIQEHNNFLDDIIAIIKPALHLAHSILEKILPGYMHIIDWIIEICQDVASGLSSPA